MTDREVFVARYQRALDRIGMAGLMNLPKPIKEVLKETTDLVVKTKMLEMIADARYNNLWRVRNGHKGA